MEGSLEGTVIKRLREAFRGRFNAPLRPRLFPDIFKSVLMARTHARFPRSRRKVGKIAPWLPVSSFQSRPSSSTKPTKLIFTRLASLESQSHPLNGENGNGLDVTRE